MAFLVPLCQHAKAVKLTNMHNSILKLSETLRFEHFNYDMYMDRNLIETTQKLSVL